MQNGKAAGFVGLSVILLVALGFVLGCSELIMLGVPVGTRKSASVSTPTVK